MRDPVKIKPCPHCGGSASISRIFKEYSKVCIIFVRCDYCGARGASYVSNAPSDLWEPDDTSEYHEACEAAAAAWNKRTRKRAAR